MPKLVLPSANESIMLKIIYSIFNSDYTRQGDLNLITKLEGFKTNPFKSDTVDEGRRGGGSSISPSHKVTILPQKEREF